VDGVVFVLKFRNHFLMVEIISLNLSRVQGRDNGPAGIIAGGSGGGSTVLET
jgi:hypothetical protein